MCFLIHPYILYKNIAVIILLIQKVTFLQFFPNNINVDLMGIFFLIKEICLKPAKA